MKKDASNWEFHCDRLQSLDERITSNSRLDDIKGALSSKDYKVPICNNNTWISTIMEFHRDETKLQISPGKICNSTLSLRFLPPKASVNPPSRSQMHVHLLVFSL